MKDFLKMTLAAVCGFIIVSIISCFLAFSVLGALALSGSGQTVIPDSAVLSIDMSKLTIAEQGSEGSPISALSSLSGTGTSSVIGIWDATRALRIAAEDPAIQYIYMKTDGNLTGLTGLEEFRAALKDFRELSGKPIVSYIESPTGASYYLSSVADKVYMTSYSGATTMINGVSSQMIFLGDLLKNLGVNVQLIRHGKYKSAGEMYTRNSSSADNREQNQRMVDSLWEQLATAIAESREISVEDLNAAIDGLKLNVPVDFVDCDLVDELLNNAQLKEKLAVLAYEEDFKDVNFVGFDEYVSAKIKPSLADEKIAVIYADGQIMDGNAKTEVYGDRFASIISKVRQDDEIKAVVLRVNSPGGSVLASEKIKFELDRLKEEKPLVASYGDYAASGGYWISANCEKIFADATTLTGSIGVFSMIPEFSKTTKDLLGVNIESVSSNKHGDMYDLMRPFDNAELAYMQRSVELIYDQFTTIVSEGRELPKETVDAIGQGRVWSGADALTIHLVDEIGTLSDAIEYAAGLAGNPDLSEWEVEAFPKPQSSMETFMELFGGGTGEENVLVKQLKGASKPQVWARMDMDYILR